MVAKILKTSLAVVLAITLCVPLTACQSNTEKTNASADTYRWENFDDGSDVLSLDVPYIPANVESCSFNVILEQGKFVNELDVSQVVLAGAIDAWYVDSITRKDDVTATVSMKKPDGWLANGAALAQIELSSDAIEFESDATTTDAQADAQAASNEEEPELSAEEINAEKGVEWPTNDESVVIENIDIDLADEDFDEQATDENSIEEVTEEQDAATSYVVAAVFADPYLDLEEDSLSLKSDKLTLKMKAVDFVLDGRIDKANLSIVNENGENSQVSVESAKLSSSSDLELVLNVPDANLDALDDANLVLAADANETQSEVKGALKVPDPSLVVSMEYKDDEKAVFTAQLNDTNDKISSSDINVSVDGSELNNASVKQNDDGTCEVSIPASSAQADSVVELSVNNVEDYAGQTSQNIQAAATVEEVGSRGIASELASGIAKDALSTLVKTGFKGLYHSIINPQSHTSIASASDEILSKLASVHKQLSSVDRRINALYDTVQAGQYEAIVNDSRALISKIYNQEILIAGKMKKFYSAEGGAAREQAIKEFYENPANATLINDLTVNMGVLYDTIMSASASSGKDLIQVYDDMCATSYNWSAQTYNARQNFREDIATVWAEGVLQIGTVYNYISENSETESQEENLKRFQDMSEEIDKLINETHKIDESSYKKKSGNDDAFYNYTIGKWLTTYLGSSNAKGWDDACVKYSKRPLRVSAATPFTSYSMKTTKYTENDHALTASGAYVTTAQVKAMLARLHNQTLKDEFDEIGLTNTAKYLITSEKLDARFEIKFTYNNWHMDTFEIALTKSDGSGFTQNKEHFDGYLGRRHKGHVNWYTKTSELFILKYV